MWNIGWGLTNKCNLSCEFCYSKNARNLSKEISEISVFKEFIDENFHLVKSINYGTGENTLCDNWIEIIKYVHEKFPNVVQGLTTNGYLSELCKYNSFAEKIIINCLEEIDVSLDFGDNERHNKFRGNSCVYDWVIKTLEFCKLNKKRTTIVFVGTNETLEISNIKNLFEIAREYNTIIRLNPYRPAYGIDYQSNRFIPDFEVIKKALEYISDNYKILSLSDPLFSAIFTHGDKPSADPSGFTSIRILPDGSITPSTYLITEEFRRLNIKIKNVFKELEKDDFKNLIKRIIPEECVGCKYVSVCQGGALDRRYLWYKNFGKRDPYCPFRNNEFTNISKLKVMPNINFQSVHNEYLPTLFFSN